MIKKLLNGQSIGTIPKKCGAFQITFLKQAVSIQDYADTWLICTGTTEP